MTVKVGVTVTEGNKSRVQPYEGLIIGIHRAGVASTITVRKSLQGFGVERIFPDSLAVVLVPRGQRRGEANRETLQVVLLERTRW